MSAGDLVLDVVSARGEVSWTVFKKCVDSLIADKEQSGLKTTPARINLLRRLDALGHVEVGRGSETVRIVVAPSCLARLPTDTPSAVFCGARSRKAALRIGDAITNFGARLTVNAQRGELGDCIPARLAVLADSEEVLVRSARALGVHYQPSPVSWLCGQLSVGLDEVAGRLRWGTMSELQWQRSDFDVQRATFRPRSGARPERCLTRYLDPIRGNYRYYLWNGDSAADVDPDWGRYLALRDAGVSILYYDRSSQVFGVPRTAPLPRLLARALTLCSGYSSSPPRRSPFGDRTVLDAFSMVPKALVDLIAVKLGQDVAGTRLEL